MTQQHPDKGGDAEQFAAIKTAYEVLSDPDKVSLSCSGPIFACFVRLVGWLPTTHHCNLWYAMDDPHGYVLQKAVYDLTGKVQLSVEEQLRQSFGQGESWSPCA